MCRPESSVVGPPARDGPQLRLDAPQTSQA
jgi:hypothetical protein